MTRWLPGVLLAVVLALPFVLGGGRGEVAPKLPDEDILRIISPHRRETRLEYSRAFRDYMRRVHDREVDILWLDPGGGTSAILRDLQSRYTANPRDPGVDILFGGGVDPYPRAVREGWLKAVAVPDADLAVIPPESGGILIRDPDNHWFGVALSSFGLVYNQRLLDRLGVETPKRWADVGRPELRTWVAGGNPASSGAVHSCYEVVLQAYGWERGWEMLARAAANTRVFGESASTAPTEVCAGDAALGMAIQHYAEIAIHAADDPTLGFMLPAGQTIVSPDAIGQLRGPLDLAPGDTEPLGAEKQRRAEKRDALAGEFIRFVLSAEGQRLLYRPAGVDGQLFSQNRYPVRNDLYHEPHAPSNNPYVGASGVKYTSALANARWDLLNDLSTTWFIDTHPELTAAWAAVLARAERTGLSWEPEAAKLFAPPMTQEELLRLAADDAALAGEIRQRRNAPAGSGVDEDREKVIRALETKRMEARMALRLRWAVAARVRYLAFLSPASAAVAP